MNSSPTLRVKFLPHGSGLPAPQYQTEHASGMDLHAAVDAPLTIAVGAIACIPAGIALEVPVGFEGQVRARSGLALNHGLAIVNAPGTIDADYRGEVKVIMVNLGMKPFVVERGARIAQLVVAPVCRARIEVAATLAETARNAGGFGHTGR